MEKVHPVNVNEEPCYREIACEWLKYSEFRLKESSYQKYRGILRKYLLPAFGDCPVSQMSACRIREFLADLREPGHDASKSGLSPQYINSILGVLRETSCYGASRGAAFPCSFRYLSQKVEHKECSVFSHEECVKLIACLLDRTDRCKMGILLCFYTGVRLGELCALQWQDIDLEERFLKITHTMQRLSAPDSENARTKVVITSPKTASSRREIPLPEFLFQKLRDFSCDDKNAFFLSGTSDRFIEPRVMQYRFLKYTRECGIRPLNFHALRHTFATQCVEKNFELKSLSEILGHSSVNITLNRYVHSSRQLKQRNMDKLCLDIAVD